MEKEEQFVWTCSKGIPVKGSYDVIVIGGGVAGCAAALSAARNGAKVCLAEREFMAGGLATLGFVWCYLPLCDGNGNQIAGGIAEEFLKLSVLNGSGKIPDCWLEGGNLTERKRTRYESEFNPYSFAANLEQCLLDSGVELRYGSQVCSVVKAEDKISAVITSEKEGLCALKCKYLIDASGDADAVYLAEDETETRDDNRLAYWTYSCNKEELSRQETQSPLYGKLPPEDRTYSGVKTEDITDFCIDARNRIRVLQEKKKIGMPVAMSSIPQFRMSRRIVGSYTLKLEDEGIWFDDCVGMIPDWRYRGSVYCVPYRVMLPRQLKNVWAAGRCVSAVAEAGDTVRSIPACAVFGQAAGTAAALANELSLNSAEVPVEKLQEILKRDKVLIDKSLLSKRVKNETGCE